MFASVDCAVEEFRGEREGKRKEERDEGKVSSIDPQHPLFSPSPGKHDAWNGFLGGAAAGTALGVRLPSAGATVGAALALGVAAAAVDVGGRSLVADRDALRSKVSAYPPPAASE